MEKFRLRAWEVDALTPHLLAIYAKWTGEEEMLPGGQQVKKFDSLEAAIAAGAS